MERRLGFSGNVRAGLPPSLQHSSWPTSGVPEGLPSGFWGSLYGCPGISHLVSTWGGGGRGGRQRQQGGGGVGHRQARRVAWPSHLPHMWLGAD